MQTIRLKYRGCLSPMSCCLLLVGDTYSGDKDCGNLYIQVVQGL